MTSCWGGRILLHWEFEDSCLWGRGGQMEANTERGLTQGSHSCVPHPVFGRSHMLVSCGIPPPHPPTTGSRYCYSCCRWQGRNPGDLTNSSSLASKERSSDLNPGLSAFSRGSEGRVATGAQDILYRRPPAPSLPSSPVLTPKAGFLLSPFLPVRPPSLPDV